jgi:hypothetical protein
MINGVSPEDRPGSPIGSMIRNRFDSTRFKGYVKPGFSEQLGISYAEAIVSLHERGIKIRNIYHTKQLEIHFSQILSLNISTREESYSGRGPGIGSFMLGILLVITLGVIALFASDLFKGSSDGSAERTRQVSCLVIIFRDISKSAEHSLCVTGKKHRIRKFIRQFETQQKK